MPYADPEREREYQHRRWQTHGAVYNAARPAALPPLSRRQVLDEDIAQARELERLETGRLGRWRAAERFAAWLAGERRWIRISSTPFAIGGLDAAGSD